MSLDFKTSFITYYVQSLCERTRHEKTGTKFGFDWIIYNLAISENWTPYRLPFFRNGPNETSKTKTEAEFGIDLAFLSSDKTCLRIFVLKDEVLKNSTWGGNSFDIDLRNAASPDLSAKILAEVKRVEIVLAYNKDEDRTGVVLYDRLVAGLGTKVGDEVELCFDRWNLTGIVERVKETLLTPNLLPQKFFSHFSYICSQFNEFEHGSDEWENQLVPNWRRFLDQLFSENADERCVRLLPVALLLLKEHGSDSDIRSKETGWIDLIEWGMLAAWQVLQTSGQKRKIEPAVAEIWLDFYVEELQRFYRANIQTLSLSRSLDKPQTGSYLDAIASSVIAHWHVGRLGILGLAYDECLPVETVGQQIRVEMQGLVADWISQIIDANPSTQRPLIDLHHVELFLCWRMLVRVNRIEKLREFFFALTNRLIVRRFRNAHIPFIDGRNSIATVLEYCATNEMPDEFCESSSVYLLCLLELVAVLQDEERNDLLWLVYHKLVMAQADDGPISDCAQIDLMMWHPPEKWEGDVLVKSLADQGECTNIMFGQLDQWSPSGGNEIAAELERLVTESREKRPFEMPDSIPTSVAILGCLKHRSPVPSEYWRVISFPQQSESEEVNSLSKKPAKKSAKKTKSASKKPAKKSAKKTKSASKKPAKKSAKKTKTASKKTTASEKVATKKRLK